jgi:4'-phosphopantetheinyl transferase
LRTELPTRSSLEVVDDGPPVAVAVEPGPTAVDWALVAPDERETAAGMGRRRGGEFLRGRVLLRRLAAETLDLPHQWIRVRVAPTGAIELAGYRAGVSISHTASHTAAAVWPAGRVGIDIEQPPADLTRRLIERCCRPWADHVDALPAAERAATFARVWTVQEACVKAVGLGLAGAPWRIPVHPDARRGRWGAVRWSLHDTWAPAALALAVRPHP